MFRGGKTVTLLILVGTADWAADVKAGKTAYDQACRSCHGADHAPSTTVAKMMKVEIQDLKSARVQGLSTQEMKKIISEGKGKMMPVKSVSGNAVEDIIAYVTTFKK